MTVSSRNFLVSHIIKPNILKGSQPIFPSLNTEDTHNRSTPPHTATPSNLLDLAIDSKEHEFLSTAAYIRHLVFVQEQQCNPMEEIDDLDAKSVHFLLYDHQNMEIDNKSGVCSASNQKLPVATCRIFEIEPQHWKLGRLAVLKEYRGMKLGQKLMKVAEDYILNQTDGLKLSLNAQKDKMGFYEKMGCIHDPSAGEWIEENMVHVKMFKKMIRNLN